MITENFEYCRICDRGGHECPGCGTVLEHPGGVCDQCREEVLRGER